MKLLLLAGILVALWALWYVFDRMAVKKEGRKLIDVGIDDEQSIDEEIQALYSVSSYNMVDAILNDEPIMHEEGIMELIHDTEMQDELDMNCPICNRDMDMIFDACSECGYNPYSEDY